MSSLIDPFAQYEVLHRVHLIPSIDDIVAPGDVNTNVFQNLDSPVSEGGENFSAGEKQLIWFESYYSSLDEI